MHSFFFRIVLYAIFIVTPFMVETGAAEIRFNTTTWTTEDGLPQNTVNRIIQSHDGYLWLATNGGLVRFDGVRFFVYTTANLPGLKNNHIRAILETPDRRIWIATHGGGLAVLNLQRTEARNYSVEDGLETDFLTNIHQDNNGRIWIHGADSIQFFQDGGFHFINRNGMPYRGSFIFLFHDSRNQYWFMNREGLFCLKNGIDDDWINVLPEAGARNRRYHYFYEDQNTGTYWLADLNGLMRYRDNVFTEVFHRKRLGIRIIFEDRSGNTWVGSGYKGFFRLETAMPLPENKAEVKDGPDRLVPVDDQQLANLKIQTALVDREGTIWLGTIRSGLVRLRKSIVKTYSEEHGLLNDIILSIHRDPKGKMWVSTNGGGVFYMENGRFKPFRLIKDNFIWSIITDGEGVRWFGSFGSGLYRVEGKTVTRYDKADGLPDDCIVVLYRDSNNNIWIGTVKGGVCRYRDGKFETFGESHGFVGENVAVIREDSGGSIWIGTTTKGLYRYKDKMFTRWSMKNGLSYNYIRAIFEDTDGAMWFGTNGGGLNRLKNGQIAVVKKENGLYDNIVSTIQEDDRGNLWMTCNRGVYRVSLKQLNDFADGKIIRVHSYYYDKDDGMISSECNGGFQPSTCKTADGKLWIPTIRGIAVFDTAKAAVNKISPQMVIEKISTGDKTYLPKPGIEIDAGAKNIDFHFTAFSFVNPGRVRFKCMLQGFSPKWIELGERRIAYFTELSPGKYTFRVKACNNDGIWNRDDVSVSFYKRPFFYQTWWFYLFCFLFVAGMGILVYYTRIRHLKKREALLEEQVSHRTAQLQEANKTARREREAAVQANRSKGEFLARMSHEIRTPLNSVIGFSELLSATGLDSLQHEYVETISHSGEALLDLIDDILDFSKIEAGILTFDPVDFDPEVTAYDVCEFILPRIGERPVEVLCSIGDRVPAFIKQDPGRFRQVLVNLMSNAAKFTEKGEIQLAIDVLDETEDRLKLHCSVRDTGIGISLEKIGVIFNVFQQADGSVTRKYGGTGLGLAICKQIARYMDGDISVESIPGQGSTFYFTAWVEKSGKLNTCKFPTISLAGKYILVVDDNRTNLEIVRQILTGIQVDVHVEADSRNVIPLLMQQQIINKPFDLCILDGHMPFLSGLQLAARIRELPPPLGNTPLLAFTSIAVRQSRDIRAAGFDGFLPKPVQSKKLIDVIKSILESGSSDFYYAGGTSGQQKKMVTQHSIRESAKQSVSILLVEDNEINRKLARFLLTQAGYPVEFAGNGAEAVDKYLEDPKNYDLIFMDIQMPGMDGREATRIIREKGFRDIPIIAMTAESMKGDREKCLMAGMNDYISKPIRREVVFSMIKKWILD